MVVDFMKSIEAAAIKSNPKLDAFLQDPKHKAFIDGMKQTIDQEFGNDPEVKAALQNFQMGLVRDQKGAFIGELGKVIDQHPEAQENLTNFVKEHRDAARGVILHAGENPDAILEVAEMGRLASDSAPAPTQAAVGASATTTTGQPTAEAPTQTQVAGTDATAPQQNASADTQTPTSGRQKVGPLPAATGGMDMSNLGAGLQEMFSKLATFLQALPQIIEAFAGMFKQAFSGMKGGNLLAAGNGGPDGPASQLSNALGVKPQDVAYQYGNNEPTVAFNPAQPGTYRDQQTPRMPTDPLLDRALNPRLEPTQVS